MPEAKGDATGSVDRASVVLVVPPGDESKLGIDALKEDGHDLARTDTLAQAADKAEGMHVDIVIFVIRGTDEIGMSDAKRARRALAGKLLVVLPDGPASVRKEALAELSPIAKIEGEADADALRTQVGRMLEIQKHRRELEACEEGLRECKLKEPRHERVFYRHRKALLIGSLLVIIAAAVAVPLLLASIHSTTETVKEGAGAASDVVETMQRVEGYLQRDEERKLRRENR